MLESHNRQLEQQLHRLQQLVKEVRLHGEGGEMRQVKNVIKERALMKLNKMLLVVMIFRVIESLHLFMHLF